MITIQHIHSFFKCYSSNTKNIYTSSNHWIPSKAKHDTYFQDHHKHWKYNEIMTVKLNCNNWTIEYFRDEKNIRNEGVLCVKE